MRLKGVGVVLMSLFSCGIFAQEKKTEDSLQIKDEISQIHDSLIIDNPHVFSFKEIDGIRFIDYRHTKRIDSLWQAELTNSDLYPKIKESILDIPYSTEDVSPSDYQELTTEVLKERLDYLNSKTPFEIPYSIELENTIRTYLKRNKKSYERLMSLSMYYFPLFERELDKYDVPLELKYLPIIESALNPQARSPMGATGLWQFMFATGKMHGLSVSNYVDERMDPEKSTTAAAEYLSELYKIFGDWNLVLAAYNSGPGNVTKAIRRSGGESDYWKLKTYLPRETSNYVPAFLATVYLFNYAEEHGFEPYLPERVHFQTDTIHVNKALKFDQIVEATGVDKDLLAFLNPAYKLHQIPHIADRTFVLRLPIAEAGIFAANEQTIYENTDLFNSKNKEPRYELVQHRINYKVKSGDYLGKIANKYGVSVANLKKWNRLHNNNLRIGQNLVVYPKEVQVASAQPTRTNHQNSAQTASQKYYTVKSGDSIWSISKKINGVSVAQIKKWNGISGDYLKPGMRLKVSEG